MRVVEQRGGAVEDAASGDIRVGDDQRPRQTEPAHQPRQIGERAAADRHQPGGDNQSGHIRASLSAGFFNTKRSTPPGCSPASIISHPVVWQKC